MCACSVTQRNRNDETTGVASILIADDEATFREATCRLLQREGFSCCGAQDTEEAIECLRSRQFDLLVADIRMPRNPDLRVVRETRELDRQMPVILVTGYPSMDTAIRSVEMSVVAYLTKPLDFGELLRHVRSGVEHSQKLRAVSAVQRRLQSCLADLEAFGSRSPAQDDPSREPTFVATIRTLASCLSELLELADRSGQDLGTRNLCELLDCPQQPDHLHAILETIEALKKTKNTFKSKALAQLRVKLESVVKRSACGD